MSKRRSELTFRGFLGLITLYMLAQRKIFFKSFNKLMTILYLKPAPQSTRLPELMHHVSRQTSNWQFGEGKVRHPMLEF